MKYIVGDICVVSRAGTDKCSNFKNSAKAKYIQIKKVHDSLYVYYLLDDNLKRVGPTWDETCDCFKDKHLDYYCHQNLASTRNGFHPGDEVRLVYKYNNYPHDIELGEEGEIESYNEINYTVRFFGSQNTTYVLKKENLELITSNETNKLEGKPMETLKKFIINVLTKEPMKSFRKSGITDGENIVTDVGAKVFLTWLISHDTEMAKAFKAEVVDEMLKKEEKEKNK